MSEIRESDSEGVYIVRSQSHDGVEYEVDNTRYKQVALYRETNR